MTEPTLEARPTTDRTPKSPGSTPKPAPEQGLKVQARGLSFAEGERLLAPVQQKKPDPAPKAEEPVEDAGPPPSEQTIGDVAVVNAVERSALALLEARTATDRIGALVEAMLVDDQASDAAKGQVGESVKGYSESQKPGLLDGLELILNFASMARAAVGLLRSVPVASQSLSIAPGFIAPTGPPPKVALAGAGPGLDAASATTSVVKGVSAMNDKRSAHQGGDAVVGMVAAVQGYIASVQQSVATLNNYALGKEQSEIGFKIQLALIEQKAALDFVATMKSGVSQATADKLKGLRNDVTETIDEIVTGIDLVHRLVAAREPGAEMAKGTHGRSVFDLVASSSEGFSMHLEQELNVVVDARSDFTTSEEPVAYWLHAATPQLRAQLDALIAAGVVGPVRAAYAKFAPPSFALGDMRCVPAKIGQPVATLVPPAVHAYETVTVNGDGASISVSRAEWESPAGQQKALMRVSAPDRHNQIL